jgi:hypothetical protein
MNKTAIRLVIYGSVLGLTVACQRVQGPAQLPVPADPIIFKDANSGKVVVRLLVIPRYSSGLGVATGFGHGPEWMVHRYYVANPFIYTPGESFKPYQPESSGVGSQSLGWFAGKSVSLDGIVVVAAGYKAKWTWSLWERNFPDQFQMVPLPQPQARTELREIEALLNKKKLTGSEKDRWSLGEGLTIEMRLSAEEKAMVQSFIRDALSKLARLEGGRRASGRGEM